MPSGRAEDADAYALVRRIRLLLLGSTVATLLWSVDTGQTGTGRGNIGKRLADPPDREPRLSTGSSAAEEEDVATGSETRRCHELGTNM